MRYADAPARRQELLDRLAAGGYVSLAHCAADFAVSEMTLRRDVRQLEAEGLVRRVPGGAVLAGPARALPFEERDASGSREKRRIAETALERISGAAVVALDAGTTVAHLADLLPAGTTVVSHSAPVVARCIERDDLDLVVVGGEYARDTRSFTGHAVHDALARLSVDVVVLSATAVDETGALCSRELDAETKRSLRAAARTRILVADSSKLGARARIRFARLDEIDAVVTDDAADPDDLEALRAGGVEVVVAQLSPEGAR
jgi:DeoR/GlpR family transcriptional regulator of sugar metabolism